MNKLLTSWRTSAAGFGAILTALGNALGAQFDVDPLTVADWPLVISAIIAGLGLISARDNKVTSEEANGLKPPAKIVEADK